MANSLEVRVPLLDHHVVETAAAIPAEFKLLEEKINNRINYNKKYVLKQLAKQKYSSEIIDRPKMGFGVPLGKWFATSLKDEVSDRLLKSAYLPVLFNMNEIKKLTGTHSLKRDYSAKLWNLLFLEEWMRSHSEALPV